MKLRKLLQRSCPKCKGDLALTGEWRRKGEESLVEYGCVQCGKLVEVRLKKGQEVEFKSYR